MREYASSTGNEYAEQSKFELGEMNFILALEHNAACLVNSYVTECKYGIAATIASRAPQVCAHPGEQFHHAEGFGDVVISARSSASTLASSPERAERMMIGTLL